MNLPIPEGRSGDWLHFKCPWCYEGSRNKAPFGVNVVTGLFGCFRCGNYQTIEDPEELKRLLKDLIPIKKVRSAPDDEHLLPCPDFIDRILEERGLQAEYTIARYGLAWDGSRICWPTSNGYWKRAITNNCSHKVLAPTGEKGLLGAHLLDPSVDGLIVLAEGDYAAASIPIPWVGLGIGGRVVHDHQATLLREFGIREVILFLDGDAGKDVGIARSRLLKAGIEARVARGLTGKQGPDDVPAPKRIDMLLEAQ